MSSMSMRAISWLSVLCMIVTACQVNAGNGRPAVLDSPAREVMHPAATFLLDVTAAGARLVAVGESGRIILSDDQGKHWRQAEVPTSVLLTAVEFANEKVGWAVGHSGIVLRTDDGGENWHRQLDGVQAAQLVYDAVAKSRLLEPTHTKGMSIGQAKRLIDDGPDKPLLAIKVEDANRVTVVGAFGFAFRTVDGGEQWFPLESQLNNPMGLHYYGIAKASAGLVLVGEQGIVQYQKGSNEFVASAPADGTLFGVLSLDEHVLIAYGLRGKLVRSANGGQTWNSVQSGVEASIQAGTILSNGAVLLVAENGRMIASKDQGHTFTVLPALIQPTADIVSVSEKSIMSVGPHGAQTVPVP
ncbi:YCF48-related protein [Pseudomonas putida]|uniref:WD40/YVTN/BNR-like repeat-containing protein n=1 Tax=Pseudomonas putida TaxID=303 RepID=UPI0022701A92|nr:YCF48-related protein [Pseudomonas putida]WAB99244.1 YCF48-related protein [Pseudomonas putida]